MEKKNLSCLTVQTFTCRCVLYAGSGRGQPNPTASETGLRAASSPQPTSSVVSKWLVTVMPVVFTALHVPVGVLVGRRFTLSLWLGHVGISAAMPMRDLVNPWPKS